MASSTLPTLPSPAVMSGSMSVTAPCRVAVRKTSSHPIPEFTGLKPVCSARPSQLAVKNAAPHASSSRQTSKLTASAANYDADSVSSTPSSSSPAVPATPAPFASVTTAGSTSPAQVLASLTAATGPYGPAILGAGALGAASFLLVRKLSGHPQTVAADVEAPPSGIVPRAKQAAPAALATMAATFPRAMQEEAFLKAVAKELNQLGFRRDNCIALVNTCRDEVCRPVVSLIDCEFGLSFNLSALGGLVSCGKTGFKAAMSHSPEFPCERDGSPRERYIFFAFPHVSIGESGTVGSLLRRGRGKPSSACGALIAIQGDINSGSAVVADPEDAEYVLLKRKVKAKVLRGGSSSYSLVQVTKAAMEAINDDLEKLIALTVDPATADYAVVTGVQIHSGNQVPGEPFRIERTCDYIAPEMMYAVVRGQRYDLQLEANKEDLVSAL